LSFILRHPRWFWLYVLAWLGFYIAFPRWATTPVGDVTGTVFLYVVVLGAICLAGRALARFQRNHRRGVSAR
jgi:hypothetical protein